MRLHSSNQQSKTVKAQLPIIQGREQLTKGENLRKAARETKGNLSPSLFARGSASMYISKLITHKMLRIDDMG